MNTSRLLALILTSVSGVISCQTLKTTYHDFAKTKVDEQYYVNGKGEKNGAWKRFWSENGVLVEEATFVNGELHGLHKMYDPTSGKALLSEVTTYSHNVKEGPAKFFSGEGRKIVAASGNYKNGKREGIWTFIDPINGAVQEGFKYSKVNRTYVNDEVVSEDPKCYYFPSGNLFIEDKVVNGEVVERLTYYPSGKLAEKEFFESERSMLVLVFYESGAPAARRAHYVINQTKVDTNQTWFESGRLKEKNILVGGREVAYEGYEENGSQSEKMRSYLEKQMREESERQETAAKSKTENVALIASISRGLATADSLATSGNWNRAEAQYRIIATKSNPHNYTTRDSTLLSFLSTSMAKAEAGIADAKKWMKLREDFDGQTTLINSRYDKFLSLFSDESAAIRASRPPNALIPQKHANGKFVFEKGNQLFQDLLEKRRGAPDLSSGYSQGEVILRVLDRLIVAGKEDTAELNKKLKKASSSEEVYQIFGL